MNSLLTDRLCTKCGLCCDGSLFADVELAGAAEAARLEAMGLEIDDDDGGLLVLPCGALRGRRCSIYEHRPATCRTFECRLLQDVRRGVLGAEEGEKVISETSTRIRRLRRLAASLVDGDERLPLRELCLDALSPSEGGRKLPRVDRKRAELEAGLAAVDGLIRKRFLRSSGR